MRFFLKQPISGVNLLLQVQCCSKEWRCDYTALKLSLVYSTEEASLSLNLMFVSSLWECQSHKAFYALCIAGSLVSTHPVWSFTRLYIPSHTQPNTWGLLISISFRLTSCNCWEIGFQGLAMGGLQCFYYLLSMLKCFAAELILYGMNVVTHLQ